MFLYHCLRQTELAVAMVIKLYEFYFLQNSSKGICAAG